MRPHSGEELSLRNLASLHLSLAVRADALLAHAPGIGLHSAVLLTLFHSTVPSPVCQSADNAVFCVRQASELHEMPRARGIGMARPKKKKVEKVEEVEEVEEEETPESPPAPEPPAPPSPPRKPMKPVAAESPSKSVLVRTQQESRRSIKKLTREADAMVATAKLCLDDAHRRFDRQMADMERDEGRKLPLKKPSPSSQLMKAAGVEKRFVQAHMEFYKALYEASRVYAECYDAEIAVKDAKIARLKRQLRVARFARRRRRGWSTTRVRFSL